MVSVRLDHVGKRYDAAIALSDIDLEVADGELFFLLGPSGCGKSTLLRLIAGLIDPTEGRIFFGGREVTRLPTQRRNAVMCFQNYALWPHMTVRQNVAFGLNLRPLTPDQRMERAQEALHLVQLDGFGDRKPAGLSGGEQQRVDPRSNRGAQHRRPHRDHAKRKSHPDRQTRRTLRPTQK
ncbi:MAG: ABC transporter ATP-binding protein [Tepidisphaeraceae bacterium]